MTLLDLLSDDLLDRLKLASDGLPRRVLLWLDPQQHFCRLVGHLEPILTERGARLLRSAPQAGFGQLKLKLALLRAEAAGETIVAYLPGFGPAALEPQPNGRVPQLWGLLDQRYKGALWGGRGPWEPGTLPEPPALLGWLERHGVKLADESTRRALVAGGPDSLLALYAERQRDQPLESWPRPLKRSEVEAALGGDPRDALRGLIADPAAELAGRGHAWSLTLRRIEAEYGLVPPPDAADPEVIADAFAITLALAEAWDAFGRPDDFPYRSRLPDSSAQRRRLVTFARDDLLANVQLGRRFVARMRLLEPALPLLDWARARRGQPCALPLLAEARWHAFLSRLGAAEAIGWQAARDLLLAERDALAGAATTAWEQLGIEAYWPLAAALAELAAETRAAEEQAPACATAGDLIDRYVRGWWRIERLHLQLRLSAADAGLPLARRLADRFQADTSIHLADQLTALVEQDGSWPPAGTIDVASLGQVLWSVPKGRRAVVITDACRWDLAERVRELLGDGELRPVIATLPSITPFGMTALLPLPGQVEVSFTGLQLHMQAGVHDKLEEREGRKSLLRVILLDGGKSLVDFMDLEPLLQAAKIPSTPLVVVFDNGIDEQGHTRTEELPDLAEKFARKLRSAIDRLHEAGIAEVHLVTDHGFLLLPPDEVDALGRPDVPIAQTHVKKPRWSALREGAATREVIRLPLSLAPGITLGIPRGARALEKAEPFLHGGISLQECVIPHLVSRRKQPLPRLGLDLTVSSNSLTGGTVPVILRPLVPPGQVPIEGYPPLTITLRVEAVEGPRAGETVAGPLTVQLRPDATEIKPALYLAEGTSLSQGQSLRLQALDEESGRDLGHFDLTLLVDWE